MNDEPTTTEDQAEPAESFVSLSPRRAPTQMNLGPSEAVNLVPLMRSMKDKKGRELLKSMADTVIRDYDADVRSRSERMKKLAKFQKLYASVMKAKSFPFHNCANVNLPFLTYTCLLVQARLFDMVVPANGKIMLCSPTNTADLGRADICEKFGNSYLRYRMPDWAVGMDESLMQIVINGSGFRRTYWNAYEERVCSDFIPIDDFVVAAKQKSVDPSMRDVPRYTMVQHLTIYDLEDYGDQGIYENVDGLKASDGEDEERKHSELAEVVRKEDGVTPSEDSTDEDKPRMVLEQHRKWRMPNKPGVHPDFDGRAHAVIITVDEKSRRVLRVVIREEDDPADARRFEREQAALEGYANELTAHAEQTAKAATDAAQIAAQQGMEPPEPTMGEPPPPPPGVKLDEQGNPLPPKPARRREISFFTHYGCFPGEGFYRHGFGDFLAPLAEAANTILNQHIDGVTLTNARPGFISSQLRTGQGAINIQPGELATVNAPMGSIKDSIHWLDPPQSDPSTMPLIEFLQAMAEKFGGSDILSGQPSGSNQTARGTMILNEQAMASISVMARRIKEAEKHELDKIWRCWGVFLSDEEIQEDVVDENGVPGTVKISRKLFTPDARVLPVSDTRMRTQKVDEVMNLYQMSVQNQVIATNPQAMLAITEDLLRAMDAQRVIPLIQPPPQPNPPPAVPHWQEDAAFLKGQDAQVNPADDDNAHIAGHQAFMSSPAGGFLDKNGRDKMENHIRHHVAQRLEKAGNELQQQLAGPAPGGGGLGAMAGVAA